MEIGIILAIVGIIVTIVVAEPVSNKIRELYWYTRNKKKWSPAIQVEKGIIPKHRHYAFTNWEEEVTVNENGDATKTIHSKIINLDDYVDIVAAFQSTTPEHLSIEIVENQLTITPDADYTGEQSITITACYDGTCKDQEVTVRVI